MRVWADVGLWVAVCFLAKICLHRPTCKTTFVRLTPSQAISQSFRVFIPFRSMRDTNKFHFFFHFSKFFLYKITISFTRVIKRSPGGESTDDGRSTSKSTCVVPAWTLTAFGDRPASSMSKFSASVNSDPGNGSFCVKIGDAEHVDRCSCLIYASLIVSTDLWPQETFTFLETLAMVVSESSFGAYVCLTRPAGLHRDVRSCRCHDGHFKALSSCWLVGSCVRAGENFSTWA